MCRAGTHLPLPEARARFSEERSPPMTHIGHIEGRADAIFLHRNLMLNYDRLAD